MELYNKKLYQNTYWYGNGIHDPEIIKNRNDFTVQYQPLYHKRNEKSKCRHVDVALSTKGIDHTEFYVCLNGFVFITSPYTAALTNKTGENILNNHLNAGWTIGKPLYTKDATTLYRFIENEIHLHNFALTNYCSVFDLNCYFIYKSNEKSLFVCEKQTHKIIGHFNNDLDKMLLTYAGAQMFGLTHIENPSLKVTPRETVYLHENFILPTTEEIPEEHFLYDKNCPAGLLQTLDI